MIYLNQWQFSDNISDPLTWERQFGLSENNLSWRTIWLELYKISGQKCHLMWKEAERSAALPLSGRDGYLHLLDNAIDSLLMKAYNDPEFVATLALRIAVSKQQVMVAIEDNGVGMEKNLEDLILTSSSYSTKRYSLLYGSVITGGLGAGLKLARNYIEKQNGRLHFLNKGKNKGAIFWYEVPI